MDLKWYKRYMEMARIVASWSKDPSTKVGAVLVSPDRRQIVPGYNGFPRGMADDGRLQDREQKYPRVLHAEENAVLNARTDLTAWSIFCTLPPCQHCASVLIQSGIAVVVMPLIVPGRWADQQLIAASDLRDCGVQVEELSI